MNVSPHTGGSGYKPLGVLEWIGFGQRELGLKSGTRSPPLTYCVTWGKFPASLSLSCVSVTGRMASALGGMRPMPFTQCLVD